MIPFGGCLSGLRRGTRPYDFFLDPIGTLDFVLRSRGFFVSLSIEFVEPLHDEFGDCFLVPHLDQEKQTICINRAVLQLHIGTETPQRNGYLVERSKTGALTYFLGSNVIVHGSLETLSNRLGRYGVQVSRRKYAVNDCSVTGFHIWGH